MTLNKKEKVLMKVIFDASVKEGKCMLSAVDILSKIPYSVTFLESDLKPTLVALCTEGYFDMEEATFKDKQVYCITLKEKGQTYVRDKEKAKRTVIRSLILAAAGAIVGALVKVLISKIVG